MRPLVLSLRSKMLLPSLAAAAATLVATAAAVGLTHGASTRLEVARAQDLPTLLFCQDVRAKMVLLDAQLRLAVASDDFGARIEDPENVLLGMVARLGSAGVEVLGAEEAARLRGALEGWWGKARADGQRRFEERSRAGAARTPGGISREELLARTRTQQIEDEYRAALDELEERTARAQASMDEALATAARRQRAAIAVAAGTLLAAALASAALAWWLSGRTARPVRTLSEAALRIAEGDLTQHVDVRSGDEVGALAESFRRMVARLRTLVSTQLAAAGELAQAVDQLSEHTRAQSALLGRQASAVAETTTTTRQLEQSSGVAAARAAAVLEVARRAADMSSAGLAAAEQNAAELQRIQGSVEGIVAQSGQLLDQTRTIGDVVETVRDLATQSHVLSLNASIEAARAGEAGRSFAVVAQEVRALAEQSGQGAGRIARVVGEIVTAVQGTRATTEKGSQAMAGSLAQVRASGESLREIGGIVRETSDAALQIASAVQQQSAGIANISTAMGDLDRGMEEAVGRIRALEQSAEQVTETAARISAVAAEFTL